MKFFGVCFGALTGIFATAVLPRMQLVGAADSAACAALPNAHSMVDYGGTNASEHETAAQSLLVLRDHAEAMKRQESEIELAIQARKQEAAKAAEKMNELTSLIREQEDEIKEQKRDLEQMQELIALAKKIEREQSETELAIQALEAAIVASEQMNTELTSLIFKQADTIKEQKRDLERTEKTIQLILVLVLVGMAGLILYDAYLNLIYA